MFPMFSKLLHSKTVAAVSAWITLFSVIFWVLAKLTPARWMRLRRARGIRNRRNLGVAKRTAQLN
jgi:flagellar biogenesis protein FliO